jgi:1-acyl-sn-glycerol-3-phosphate acyltransferase
VSIPADAAGGDRSAGPGAANRPWWGPLASTVLFRGLWRVTVHRGDQVPAAGPVLLASNHLGFLDGPMLVGVAPRFTQCLVKQEMFHGPLGAVLRSARQIPVDRSGGDRVALQRALSVLADGGCVGVFPEGTRGRGDVGEVRQGVAWLALRSGAPVVPVACLGTRRTGESTSQLPRLFRRLDVVFGEPVQVRARPGVPGRVALVQATEALRDRMADNVEQALRITGQILPEDLGGPEQQARGEHL